MNNRNAMLGQGQDISSIVKGWTEPERTLTMQRPYQKAALMRTPIYASNLQAQTVASPVTQTTRSRSINPNLNESSFAITLRMFFESIGWEFREEYEIKKTGKRIDFCVKAPYEDGYIFFGGLRNIINETGFSSFSSLMQSAYWIFCTFFGLQRKE